MILVTYFCVISRMENSISSTRPPKKRRRITNDEFDERFGDLSPLAEFKGPKNPSLRQSVRRFIHLLESSVDKDEAARSTVADILKQHAANPEKKLQPRYLEILLKEKYDYLK